MVAAASAAAAAEESCADVVAGAGADSAAGEGPRRRRLRSRAQALEKARERARARARGQAAEVRGAACAGGQTKEEVIETNERLRAVRLRLDESYDTAKKALVNLMTKYADSKSTRNVFQRYNLLKAMIKEVIRLETQYWTLVDIPKQEKQETVPAFVLRACSIMEKSQKSGDGVKTSAKLAEEDERRRERVDRLENMTTLQIEAENTQMTNDLYRLLKKYSALRNLIRELKSEYMNSKIYPIFPRYTILKDMIKDIMHDPDYMEVCHEVDI